MYQDKMPYCDTGDRRTDCAPFCCDPCHYYHDHPDGLYTIVVDSEEYFVCCAVRRYFFPIDRTESEEILKMIFGE